MPKAAAGRKKLGLDNVPIDHAVPDNIDYDLRVLFVGINPGLASAAKGHHFAGPTNHFWPCLSESGKFFSVPSLRRDELFNVK